MENQQYEKSLLVSILDTAPDASRFTGMFLYSFIVFVFLTCLRKVRNQAIYPHLARSMQGVSTKRRAEIRKEREIEARRLAAKLE